MVNSFLLNNELENMIKVLLILLFISSKAVCQDTAYWRVGDERTVIEYNVQKSQDTGTWVTIATVPKGKSFYWYVIPKIETNYYRIKASGYETYATKPILLSGLLNRVEVTSAIKTTSYLTWVTVGEINVDFYYIDKTLNYKKYLLTTKVSAKGDRKYSYRYYKGIYNYKYRITPVFKDGTKSLSTNFE